ncbi:hypothetical protein AVEN_147848-1 [Araneus ventricosus]|uniref:Uncharacterized protein n=1 Tax=Araneus ventricosus TaxID=182803 RepID=A0A4Y2CR68_ARAVE|nr:hypothetical protein AVEN_147848-1 [Araneus ventricosus]
MTKKKSTPAENEKGNQSVTMKTKIGTLQMVEATLSRALTSHAQYETVMKCLNQQEDTKNIIELNTRAQERLKELETILKEDQDRWLKEYGMIVITDFADNQPPISFDISFNPGNNTNQTEEATEMADETMKEDNEVAFCSPVEESVTPIIEEEFKTQGKRRRSSRSQLDEDKVAKKKPNVVATAPLTDLSNNSAKVPNFEINIPPVVIKNYLEFKFLLKRLNETKNLKCRAKPVGEFMHVFTNYPKDHRDLTEPERAKYPVLCCTVKG